MRITNVCAALAVIASGLLVASNPVSALDDLICVEEVTDQSTVKGPDGYVTTVHTECVRWLWIPDKAGSTPTFPLPGDDEGTGRSGDEPVTCEEYAKRLDSMRTELRGLIDVLPGAEYDAQYWSARAVTEDVIATDLNQRWVRSKLAYADVERIYLEQNGLDATIEVENSRGVVFTRATIEGVSSIDTSLPGGPALVRAWDARAAAGTAAAAASSAAQSSAAERDAAQQRLDGIRRQIEDLTRAMEQLRAAEKSCQ